MSDPLSLACRSLMNADPEAWELFLAAFDDYALGVTATVIQADASMILVKQGQAQQCQKLQQIFRECHLKTEQPPRT